MPKLKYLLLPLFALFMLLVWMGPALLAGYPYWVSAIIPRARELAETGIITEDKMRLVTLVMTYIHPLLSWENVLGWSAVSAGAFALALIAWWWAVKQLFDNRIAWASMVVMGFMPMYWAESLRLEGYTFALLFLFLGFALFIKFQKKQRLLALILSGACFGAAIASRSTFVTFLPWFVLSFLYLNKKKWKKALMQSGIYLIVAYAFFVLPLYPNALGRGMSPVERVQVFLPSLNEKTPGEGHLYPDQYIFENYREEFDEYTKERIASEKSFLVRQEDRHYRMLFGVGDNSEIDEILNGIWLFVNILPPLVLTETVGGIFLWLLIIPGIFVLYKKKRKLLWMMLGLWLSMELIIRFILHFGRDHLIDVGWMLALFSAIGIATVSDSVKGKFKKLSATGIAVVIVIIVSLQLVQANRKLFTRLYERSFVPQMFAATEVLKNIPKDVVIAHPRKAEFFFFSPQTPVTIHNPAIEFLSERGELSAPFTYYGVTHIMGYSEEETAKIRRQAFVQNIELPEFGGVEATPLIRMLLHVIR